ncbi:hypothetical protein GCM10023231_19860 [Olivibacter ginsenosidimutans]|uniref:Thioredoxin domain-containing protein n=1 Tax=Olivibacter ginsenosidimutans TaxID=1176537 RepID=A0ABP9B8F7_9SPHI
MKVLLTTLLLSCTSIICLAHFKLSGKINAYQQTPLSLSISIPLVYAVPSRTNANQEISIKSDGSFTWQTPLDEPHFAYLFIGDQKYLLWLKPNKELDLTIDGRRNHVDLFQGSAATENRLLQSLNFTASPFFMKRENEHYPYAAITFAGAQDSIVRPWLAEREEKFQLIRQSNLSKNDQSILTAEVQYNTLNYLSDFALSIARWKRADWSQFLTQLYDTVDIAQTKRATGFQYYLFVERYTRYLLGQALAQYQQDTTQKSRPLPYLNIPMDSAMVLAKAHGENYLAWLAIYHTFDQGTAEHYLAQQVSDQYIDGNYHDFTFLFKTFEHHFPHSVQGKWLKQYADTLNYKLSTNQGNAAIEILLSPDSIKSITKVLRQFKGKVVYLDIWGTWCGPCKEELTYLPQLKDKFNGQDLIFVYLDMDDDARDQLWRDFIYVNNITGIHLRMNNKAIQSVWNELLPDQVELRGQYPSYFIFDKQGNLVKGKAKRPSDQETLYQQLALYLK